MKNAFVDINGVLTSHGFAESNNDDRLIEVPEDFEKEPGKWRYVGDTWVVYAAPQRVPATVTKRQGRLALLEAGKYQAVLDAIEQLHSPEKERALIEWDATNYERASPFLQQIAVLIELDSQQLDSLFITAAQL